MKHDYIIKAFVCALVVLLCVACDGDLPIPITGGSTESALGEAAEPNAASQPTDVPLPTDTPMPSETPTPTETPLPPKVTLSSIENDQTVPCFNDLSGTYVEGLDEYIWPVVRIGGGFYPQDVGVGKAASKISGEWYGVARFGNCDNLELDKGKRFELLIVTANESANAEFEAYFENAINTGDWGPMPALPSSGIETQVHISVIRE